jgi:hypothetical protein
LVSFLLYGFHLVLKVQVLPTLGPISRDEETCGFWMTATLSRSTARVVIVYYSTNIARKTHAALTSWNIRTREWQKKIVYAKRHSSASDIRDKIKSHTRSGLRFASIQPMAVACSTSARGADNPSCVQIEDHSGCMRKAVRRNVIVRDLLVREESGEYFGRR